jgi:hypothetical protein
MLSAWSNANGRCRANRLRTNAAGVRTIRIPTLNFRRTTRVYFVNIGKNINTPLKGVFEVILTKISQS